MKITIPSATYFKECTSIEEAAKMIKRNTKRSAWEKTLIHAGGKEYVAVDNKEKPSIHFKEVK